MILANRFLFPDDKEAILWDMDGVLLDTLSFDYELCNRLLQMHLHENASVSRSVIREYFPYDLPEFWRRLVAVAEADLVEPDRTAAIERLVGAHEKERRAAVCPLNPGVESILSEARKQGLKQAVVSNNPTEEVCEMLRRSKILELFDDVIGNDLEDIAKKPAPDTYLLATRRLNVEPARCVVVEDSLLGAEAGHRAGCFVAGTATGASEFKSLNASPFVDTAYTSFAKNSVKLGLGNVTVKQIVTPNEFVSHMAEHIAWRMGCSVELNWNNSDWFELGRQLGTAVDGFGRLQNSAAVLGMIDDGSAEVSIVAADRGELVLGATAGVDLDWFLGLRCEQLTEGTPLVEMLKGVADACSTRIEVTVCSLEDPHHTWEGVFRAVGIALSRLYVPPVEEEPFLDETPVSPRTSDAGWTVFGGSMCRAEVIRETAETKVRVAVDVSRVTSLKCRFEVSDSIRVEGCRDLLERLSKAAGLGLEIEFSAKFISSSHVVMEDIGMVLGRALKEILIARMERIGVNGAGSSVRSVADLDGDAIRVGLSVEGRKFLQWVPFAVSHMRLRREFLVGHTVGEDVFSEDLDDFLDGFVGGLTASVVVHLKEILPPSEGWPLVFSCLGKAIAEALSPNPMRKGVPPGVKATLA